MKNVPTNLSSLESKVNKLDADKLVPVPANSSKLSDAVENDVVKKDVYNAKIKNIEDKIPDITNLVTKTSLNAKINEVEGEIPSITNLATTAALKFKINDVKGKIPSITNLASTATLTAIENKMPNVSSLVKRTDYNTKISETEKKTTDHDHDKYITTPEFNKLTAGSFAARLAYANLANKSDITNFVKQIDFDEKLKNVTSYKNELNELSKKLKQYQQKD